MSGTTAIEPEPFDIPCRDGLSIRGEVYRPATSIGSVVVCHGFKGFAHWAFFPYVARKLAEKELTAITFDFSGSGIGPDRESFTQAEAFANNTFTRELEDLELLEEYARRRHWIAGKFGLFGHSRGGGMAILYAAAEGSNVNSLVTWAAISYTNRWSPEDTLVWRKRGYAEVTNSRTGQVMRLGTDLLDDVELHGKTKVNIEGETCEQIARTMILPAAVRHLSLLKEAGVTAAAEETQGLVDELWTAILALEDANLADNQPDEEPLEWATYMRDKVIPAMAGVREVADKLERIVADDLWPLPRYSEMLFIK